jgi:hypothetical protein
VQNFCKWTAEIVGLLHSHNAFSLEITFKWLYEKLAQQFAALFACLKSESNFFYWFNSVHCWRHRLWVSKRVEESVESQMQFNTTKISQDFSNYSAWHYRSKLLDSIRSTEVSTEVVTKLKDGELF